MERRIDRPDRRPENARLAMRHAVMLKRISPARIPPPFARYSHGVVVEAGARLLFCSGQLGVAPGDRVPDSAEEQAELCFRNIDEILIEAGMGRRNLVRLNAFVTARDHMAGYMAARDRYIEGLAEPPASTLMVVSGFAREIFKVEVEAIAAAAPSREGGPATEERSETTHV